MRAMMDGTAKTIFINTTLQFPVSLVIDQPANRLFWADLKKHSIESINLDGISRLVTIDYHKDPRLRFPYSIDVFEDYVYGIMKESGTLFKVDKFGRGDSKIVILKAELRKTFQLILYHENKHLPSDDSKYSPRKSGH